MKGDFHVQFRENARMKFLCVTRFGNAGRELARQYKLCKIKKV